MTNDGTSRVTADPAETRRYLEELQQYRSRNPAYASPREMTPQPQRRTPRSYVPQAPARPVEQDRGPLSPVPDREGDRQKGRQAVHTPRGPGPTQWPRLGLRAARSNMDPARLTMGEGPLLLEEMRCPPAVPAKAPAPGAAPEAEPLPGVSAQAALAPEASQEEAYPEAIPIPLALAEGEDRSREVMEVMGPVRRAAPPACALGAEEYALGPGPAAAEQLARWVREKIPPRPLFEKGCGALGQFVCTSDMGDLTAADFLSARGRVTPALVRFSLMAGRGGSPDTVRDVRGMAVRLYTGQGNLDLLALSIPVFFLGDGARLPQLARALGPDPRSGLSDRTRFWDFCAGAPETLSALSYLYAGEGLSRGYGGMGAFCPCTHLLRDRAGRPRLARFAWTPRRRERPLSLGEAEALARRDPDAAARDLWDTLDRGEEVSYDLTVQSLDPAVVEFLEFDPLDATAAWPEDRFPAQAAGTLTLTENPGDVFAQVEQAAFSPGNLVPGIGLSGDRLLSDAAFAMADSGRYRLGREGPRLPVNRPLVPVEGTAAAPAGAAAGGELPPTPSGTVLPQLRPPRDPYVQPAARYAALDERGQFLLAENMAAELAHCPQSVVHAMLEHLYAASPQWCALVQERVEFFKQML